MNEGIDTCTSSFPYVQRMIDAVFPIAEIVTFILLLAVAVSFLVFFFKDLIAIWNNHNFTRAGGCTRKHCGLYHYDKNKPRNQRSMCLNPCVNNNKFKKRMGKVGGNICRLSMALYESHPRRKPATWYRDEYMKAHVTGKRHRVLWIPAIGVLTLLYLLLHFRFKGIAEILMGS